MENVFDRFRNACTYNKITEALKQVNKLTDINEIDENGESFLWISCKSNRKDIAIALIKAGANVNQVNKNGRSLLFEVCTNNYIKMAKILIEAGANVNLKYEVCVLDYHKMAKLLIDSGAELDKCGQPSLWIACFSNYREIATLLFEGGLEVDSITFNGWSLLDATCSQKNFDIAIDLINWGAEVQSMKKHGYNLLWVACQRNLVDIVHKFIQAGFMPNRINEDTGDTALHVTCRSGHFDLCLLLLRGGANPYLRNKLGEVALELLDADLATEARNAYFHYRFGSAMLLSYQPERAGAAPNIVSFLRNRNYDCWRYALQFL